MTESPRAAKKHPQQRIYTPLNDRQIGSDLTPFDHLPDAKGIVPHPSALSLQPSFIELIS